MSATCMLVDSTNDEDEIRVLKRRRYSGRTPSCDSILNDTNKQRHPTFWLPDGDFVLVIEDRLLRIHRRRLCCSSVFADMLEFPQPSVVERVDGFPSCTLLGDSLADWEVALRWIYHSSEIIALGQCIPFDTIASGLRIATKYDISQLRQWAIENLTLRWPEDVVNMRLNALPNAAEAIMLAQECHVESILPSAFYALAVQKFHSGADGGRSHLILSPLDLRRLLAGREALQDTLVRIVADPLSEPGVYSNESCATCGPRRAQYWRTRLAPDPKAMWNTWLVRELERMQADEAFLTTLCGDCVHAHVSTVRWRLGRLRGSLPSFFLL